MPAYYETISDVEGAGSPTTKIDSWDDPNLSPSLSRGSLDRFNQDRFKVRAGNFRGKGYSEILSSASDLANFVANAVITASSSLESASYSLSFIQDGIEVVGTPRGWESSVTNANHTEWVQFHFNGYRTVSRVKLFAGNCPAPFWPTAFQIQTWNGSSWVTQASRTNVAYPGCTGQFDLTQFVSPVTTTDVRVYVTQETGVTRPGSPTNFAVMLGEVEIMP